MAVPFKVVFEAAIVVSKIARSLIVISLTHL
jgi:hypothetical protein